MPDCPDCEQQDCGCLDEGCKCSPDASCVFYNLNVTTASGLVNLNIPNGTALDVILEAIDSALGNSTTFNFDGYSIPYLKAKYTITDLQSFAESTDSEFDYLSGRIDTIQSYETSNYTALNQSINSILYPHLYDTCDIGIEDTDTLSQALQKFISHYCFNAGQSSSSTTIPELLAIDTNSISWILSGQSNHTVLADVKISVDTGNAIELKSDGLFVPIPSVTGAQTLSWNASSRRLSLSGGGGSVVIPDSDAQNLSFDILSRSLSISGGNSVDLSSLTSALSETALVAGETSTVSFTQTGTKGHTITASVKVDDTQDNALSITDAGLFVPPAVATAVTGGSSASAANSVEVGTGGTSYTITPEVKVSSSEGNQVQVKSDGLYVPEVAPSQPIEASDTSTVDITIIGTEQQSIAAAVKVSSQSGNSLQIKSDGLYAPESQGGSGTNLVANDSSTIDFTTSGTAGHTLTGSVKLDSSTSSLIKVLGGGIGLDVNALAAAILTAVGNNQTLKDQLCTLISDCPCPCDNPDNVTVTYS